MYNPMENIRGKWDIQNMDDEHYYRMGIWEQQGKPGIYQRIVTGMSRILLDLRCRIEAVRKSPNPVWEQQCGCAEA